MVKNASKKTLKKTSKKTSTNKKTTRWKKRKEFEAKLPSGKKIVTAFYSRTRRDVEKKPIPLVEFIKKHRPRTAFQKIEKSPQGSRQVEITKIKYKIPGHKKTRTLNLSIPLELYTPRAGKTISNKLSTPGFREAVTRAIYSDAERFINPRLRSQKIEVGYGRKRTRWIYRNILVEEIEYDATGKIFVEEN